MCIRIAQVLLRFSFLLRRPIKPKKIAMKFFKQVEWCLSLYRYGYYIHVLRWELLMNRTLIRYPLRGNYTLSECSWLWVLGSDTIPYNFPLLRYFTLSCFNVKYNEFYLWWGFTYSLSISLTFLFDLQDVAVLKGSPECDLKPHGRQGRILPFGLGKALLRIWCSDELYSHKSLCNLVGGF